MQPTAGVVIRRIGVLGLLVCAALPLRAQSVPPPAPRSQGASTPNSGTGAISGTVIGAASGGPVRKAQVRVSWGDKPNIRTAVTDTVGHFEFLELPAADFTLTVAHPGYLDVTYGQRQPGAGGPGTPIHLADRQKFSVNLRMPAEGAFGGVITDENGDPAFNIEVTAMRVVTISGARTLKPAGIAVTDDRGIYRIPALVPGVYIVSAAPAQPSAPGTMVVSANGAFSVNLTRRAEAGNATQPAATPEKPLPRAPVYYPGTAYGPRAIEVPLSVSEERTGIDIQLQVVPAFPVWGRLAEPTGLVPAGATVYFFEPGLGVRKTTSTPDGMFMFTDVAPGVYSLMAKGIGGGAGATSGSTRLLWGTATVSVDERMADALREYDAAKMVTRSDFSPEMIALRFRLGLPTTQIDLRGGLEVSGDMVFLPVPPPTIDARRPINPQGFSVLVQSFEGAEIVARQFADVDSGGRFTFGGVAPGHYRLSAAPLSSAPSGWTLMSAIANGRDVLDFGLDISPDDGMTSVTLTFTDRLTEVSGALLDGAGKPVAGSGVVVFPADSQYWLPQARRIQTALTAADGHFTIRGLPAGMYHVAALGDVEAGAWYDPLVLQQLQARSAVITLADGERKVQDVRAVK